MIELKALRLLTQNGMQSFAQGRILDGIAALQALLPYCRSQGIIHAEAESLEDNYHRMLEFLRDGGNDEKRGEVQTNIKRQGICLLERACRATRLAQKSDRYSKARRRLYDIYSHPKTDLLDKWNSLLTPEETAEAEDDLFDLIWTSPLWTAEDTAFWYDFLLNQRELVQQHLVGALFLSLWEHYDNEKMQLLGLMAENECWRTHIMAVAYLLLLRIRHKQVVEMLPPLPDSLLSPMGRKQIAQVSYEMLLMLVSEKDMEKELKEAEEMTKKTHPSPLLEEREQADNGGRSIQDLISLRGRYLKNRLQRGLDTNLSKIPLLHTCKYMHRTAHWFMPFDKTHPLFQSVLIDENGNERHNLSTIVDFILDCDIDKMATFYLVSNDDDFRKAFLALDEQELPGIQNIVIPHYTFRFIMQDLYRFFGHSPLSQELTNPFKSDLSLLDFPELASLIGLEDSVTIAKLLPELGRHEKAVKAIDDVIAREGANVSALLVKGRALAEQDKYAEAASCARSAEMLEPNDTDTLRFLVECYAKLKRFDEELECLSRLAEILPESRSIRRLIPMTMAEAGRKEEALPLLFKLDYEGATDDEDYETIVTAIADIAFDTDRLDVAERYTEKAIGAAGKHQSENQLRMGHIRLLGGDMKSALLHYEQAVGIASDLTGKSRKAILAKLRQSMKKLIPKGIEETDVQLILDILDK